MNNRFIKRRFVLFKKLGQPITRAVNNTNMNRKNISPEGSLTRNLTVLFTVLPNEITFSVRGD